jgi:hypothetical protein
LENSGVRYQMSHVTCYIGNRVLNSAHTSVVVTSIIFKSEMLLLRKVILRRFTFYYKMLKCFISYSISIYAVAEIEDIL